MNKNSKNLLGVGIVGVLGILAYKSYSGRSGDSSTSGEGSLGGSDDLTGQQGFDIDPNSPIPTDYSYLENYDQALQGLSQNDQSLQNQINAIVDNQNVASPETSTPTNTQSTPSWLNKLDTATTVAFAGVAAYEVGKLGKNFLAKIRKPTTANVALDNAKLSGELKSSSRVVSNVEDIAAAGKDAKIVAKNAPRISADATKVLSESAETSKFLKYGGKVVRFAGDIAVVATAVDVGYETVKTGADENSWSKRLVSSVQSSYTEKSGSKTVGQIAALGITPVAVVVGLGQGVTKVASQTYQDVKAVGSSKPVQTVVNVLNSVNPVTLAVNAAKSSNSTSSSNSSASNSKTSTAYNAGNQAKTSSVSSPSTVTKVATAATSNVKSVVSNVQSTANTAKASFSNAIKSIVSKITSKSSSKKK